MMKNFTLTFACLFFTVVIGGAVYEHLCTVPKWSEAPPTSLTMFQGQYGINSGPFWIPIHPLNLVLLVTALILHRKTKRFSTIAIVLGVYVLILIITFVYFVPELMDIISTPYASTIDQDLRSRAKTWEMLSLLRLAVLFPMAFALIYSLSKSDTAALK